MKFKQSILPYIAGVSTAAILFGTAVPTMAASVLKDISVIMGGISVYVDGELQSMKDVDGNTVEAMIYDGTTYLPVRAVTGMLSDKDVNWDADTQSVYIGTQPQSGAVQLEDISNISDTLYNIYTDGTFNLLDKTVNYTNALFQTRLDERKTYLTASNSYERWAFGCIQDYRLDSAYSEINGSYCVIYDTLGSQITDTIGFYSVNQYGEETLIKEYETMAADDTLNISVPLYGVNILRIKITNQTATTYSGINTYPTYDLYKNVEEMAKSVFYNVSLNPVQ